MSKTFEKIKVDGREIQVALYRCGGCRRALDVAEEHVIKETAVYVLVHPDGSQETFHERNSDDATWTEFWCPACFCEHVPYATALEKAVCKQLIAAQKARVAVREALAEEEAAKAKNGGASKPS